MKSLFGNNLNEHYVSLVRRNYEAHQKRIASIVTKTDAENYVQEIREKIAGICKFPAEKSPLNASVVSRKNMGGYTMECIVFYSRPGFPVTANLYLPEKINGKVPGVLELCGHAENGKAADAYRSGAVSLALKGFAVLVVDPIEQGERVQYAGIAQLCNWLCDNHNMMGKQLALNGDWFGTWRIWDAIRSLDYMETRPEIDSSRLCVIGNSGGGTLTAMVAALDPRPVAVAPSCYITSWRRNVENELPTDVEQMPPGALAIGLEMSDLLLAFAPRDILILGQKNDIFDPRGTMETYQEVSHINGLLGGKTEVFIGPRSHGFFVENREAAYGFLTENILGKRDSKEPEFTLPEAKETFAAGGSVANLADNRWLRELNRARTAELIAARPQYTLTELRTVLKKLLGLEDNFVPEYRVLRDKVIRNRTVVSRFGLETEKGSVMSILFRFSAGSLYHLNTDVPDTTLYVPHLDSIEEIRNSEIDENTVFYALDPRGIGEMMPSGTDQPDARNFFAGYQFDYHYAALGTMCHKPELGGRVHDLLCAIELLSASGSRIHLKAKGFGCIYAVMAAVLSDKVESLTLTEVPKSFEDVVNAEVTDFPYSCILPGILQYTDIPEMLKLTGGKISNE